MKTIDNFDKMSSIERIDHDYRVRTYHVNHDERALGWFLTLVWFVVRAALALGLLYAVITLTGGVLPF